MDLGWNQMEKQSKSMRSDCGNHRMCVPQARRRGSGWRKRADKVWKGFDGAGARGGVSLYAVSMVASARNAKQTTGAQSARRRRRRIFLGMVMGGRWIGRPPQTQARGVRRACCVRNELTRVQTAAAKKKKCLGCDGCERSNGLCARGRVFAVDGL